jgi:hypothetical protein
MDKKLYIENALIGYISCALWVTFDEPNELTADNLSEVSKARAVIDVESFVNKMWDKIQDIPASQLGHDLFLTRNRHGAGFWDRGLGEIGDELTEVAKGMGEIDVYLDEEYPLIYME